MKMIKSCTDLSQSKTLSKILPLESADMEYLTIKETDTLVGVVPFIKDDSEVDNSAYSHTYDRIACWSLAALLNVLPDNEHVSTTISRGSWKIDPVKYLPNIWWCEYEDTKNQTEFNISADNQVDACYEMVIKLHEQKLL